MEASTLQEAKNYTIVIEASVVDPYYFVYYDPKNGGFVTSDEIKVLSPVIQINVRKSFAPYFD